MPVVVYGPISLDDACMSACLHNLWTARKNNASKSDVLHYGTPNHGWVNKNVEWNHGRLDKVE